MGTITYEVTYKRASTGSVLKVPIKVVPTDDQPALYTACLDAHLKQRAEYPLWKVFRVTPPCYG